MKLQLRTYQEDLSTKAAEIVRKYGICFLACEVRVGKTIIALETCKKIGVKKVLFITKKKAIITIQKDYSHYTDSFICQVTNYESLHKVTDKDFSLVILDESHGTLSGFPKPSKSNLQVKKNFSHLPMVYLSGTLLIESASKIYPQLSVNNKSPFKEYKNFYKWFADYGVKKQIRTSYGLANDYSNIKYDKMMTRVQHLIITLTQKEAGFTTEIKEHILNVEMKPSTYSLINRVIKDRVVETKDGKDAILADTGVKLQMILLQMYSGSIKMESGKGMIIDDTKAQFIKEYFKGKKIAILYCFVQEKIMLTQAFGDLITDNLEEFDSGNKSYMGQIVANREGVSLKKADALVFLNLPFSGTSFTQGRDRTSYLGRKENNVYFICANGGLEERVLKIVRKKQTFSNKIFKKELGLK